MKPIEFKHQNIVYAKDQPEYQPLPALKLKTNEGQVICCWKMSLKERLKGLITGNIWVSLMSFNKPLTPHLISVNRKDVFSIPNDKYFINKKIHTIKWNLGIIIIRFGYFVRKYQYEPKRYNLRWEFGVNILKVGYDLRGQLPMRTWKYNHV